MLLAPPRCLHIKILTHTVLEASRVEASPRPQHGKTGTPGVSWPYNYTRIVVVTLIHYVGLPPCFLWGTLARWIYSATKQPMAKTTTLKHRSVVYKDCSHFTHIGNVEETTASHFCPTHLFLRLKGAWENWKMLFILCPSHHNRSCIGKWEHRSSAKCISTWSFLLLPAKTEEHWENGWVVLSIIQLTILPGAVMVLFRCVLLTQELCEELRCLVRITPCSSSDTRLTSTDVNIFGCAPWRRGLWVTQGEDSQLWASPSWAQWCLDLQVSSQADCICSANAHSGYHLMLTPQEPRSRYRCDSGTYISSTGNQTALFTHSPH